MVVPSRRVGGILSAVHHPMASRGVADGPSAMARFRLWSRRSAWRAVVQARPGRYSHLEEENMGLFDSLGGVLGGALKDALGQAEASALPGLVSAVLGKTDLGSLQGIVNKLQEAGLGAQVQSWLGSGANLPLSADQLRAALGNEQVRQLAQQFGLPVDAALKLLAEHLPTAVDQASPNGAIDVTAAQGQAGSLADQAGIGNIKS